MRLWIGVWMLMAGMDNAVMIEGVGGCGGLDVVDFG